MTRCNANTIPADEIGPGLFKVEYRPCRRPAVAECGDDVLCHEHATEAEAHGASVAWDKSWERRAMEVGSYVECNADEGQPCDAEDGRPCPACRAWEESFRREYERTPKSIRRLDRQTQEERDQELIDAGRGHLVARW